MDTNYYKMDTNENSSHQMRLLRSIKNIGATINNNNKYYKFSSLYILLHK